MGELAPHLTELHSAEIASKCWDEWEAHLAIRPTNHTVCSAKLTNAAPQASQHTPQSTSTGSGRVEFPEWDDGSAAPPAAVGAELPNPIPYPDLELNVDAHTTLGETSVPAVP
jgi:hypothetical protein